ncbi:MAG TPA: alpha/beta fold hydrolase [Candidatus Saccharimonadaceae bacterium]|nr:alpha/beta fold hydrolase [Candidatus Saccharimonadaceae bacterium]
MLAVLLSLALGAVWLLRPLAPGGLESHPRPVATFGEALRLVDSLRALDTPAIAPECRTELLSHGVRTARVVVLFHGLTNCPAQWDSIARIAYACGANVLVPRLPHHGFADHMTEELARMDAGELCAFTDRALDAAHGLGDRVTVAGLSIGGVMAAWAGQERRDVDRAVVIVPMFGWSGAPGPARTAALARLAGVLPNAFVWWDDKRKQNLAGPRHVYPRFATRSVAACMLLGGAVRAAAAHRAPAARSLVVLTVGNDPAVDNSATAALARAWSRNSPGAVETYEFPAALHLSHDVVDPEQVGGNPAATYPVLLRYLAPCGSTAPVRRNPFVFHP